MTKKFMYLLAASILLNVLFIGFMIGKASFFMLPERPPFPPHDRHFEKPPFLMESMQENREKHFALDEKIHDLRQQTHALLMEKEINEALYKEKVEELKVLHGQKFELMALDLYETVHDWPLEKRRTLIQQLDQFRPPAPMPPRPPMQE